MKKLILGVLMVSAVALSGCVNAQPIKFQGKEDVPLEIVAEVIESQLEMENPQYDLEVRIGHDSD